MKKELILSALIHILIFVLMIQSHLSGGDSEEKTKGSASSNSQKTGEIITKSQEIKTTLVEIDPKAPGHEKKQKKILDVNCNGGPFYGGIGITTDFEAQTVNKVMPGYPAEAAGLEHGDLILNKDEIRGEPGTEIVLSIQKLSGNIETVTIVRQKICLSG